MLFRDHVRAESFQDLKGCIVQYALGRVCSAIWEM